MRIAGELITGPSPLARLLPVGLIACSTAGAPVSTPATPSPPAITIVRLQPDTAAYASASHRLVEREVDGRVLTDQVVLRLRLTARAEPGRQVRFAIDSVVAAEPAAMFGPEPEARARDLQLVGRFSADGRWRGPDPDAATATALGEAVAAGLGDFFPPLPDSGAREGVRWIDTTETDRRRDDVNLRRRTITEYHAAGWGEAAGHPALRIEWRSEVQLEGTGEQMGQSFTLRAQGFGSGTSFVSRSGAYLGSVGHEDLEGEIEVEMFGVRIPFRQTQADTVIAVVS